MGTMAETMPSRRMKLRELSLILRFPPQTKTEDVVTDSTRLRNMFKSGPAKGKAAKAEVNGSEQAPAPPRPLSTTTATTNTTITPPTPRASRTQMRPPQISTLSSSSVAEPEEPPHSAPLPSDESGLTPVLPLRASSTSKKKHLRNLFGLRPPSLRKGSTSTIGSTDSVHQPLPPARPDNPMLDSHDDLDPDHDHERSRSRTSSIPSSKAPSELYNSNTTAATSHSHGTSQSSQSSFFRRSSQKHTSAAVQVSAPTKKKSPSRTSVELSHDNRPTSSLSQNPRSSYAPSSFSGTQKMSHTSPIGRKLPLSNARDSYASESSTVTAAGTSARHRAHGLGLANAYKMSVVDEEGRLVDLAFSQHSSAKGKERERDLHSPIGRSGRHSNVPSHTNGRPPSTRSGSQHHGFHGFSASTSKMRSTKHGSFDFERPGWSSPSQRPAVLDKAGGEMRRSVSLRDDAMGSTQNHVDTGHNRSVSAEVGGSLGRNQGRHVRIQPEPVTMDDSKKDRRSSLLGRGLSKLKSGLLAHGPFSFEPPVAGPTRSSIPRSPSSPSVGAVDRRHEANGTDVRPHRAASPVGARGHRPQKRESLPPPSSIVTRPRPKGRSLDLGIGLSWAPRTVRQEVLLPGSALAPDSNRNDYATDVHDGPGKEEVSIVGRDVANVFKNALDPSGYEAFRKCLVRFDTQQISFDGPKGVVSRVERLLRRHAPGLSDEGQAQLLGTFVRVLLQNS